MPKKKLYKDRILSKNNLFKNSVVSRGTKRVSLRRKIDFEKAKERFLKDKPLLFPWNIERFIVEARQVHGDRYSYIFVRFKGAHDTVTIKCLRNGHGFFKATVHDHIYHGAGCPKCEIVEKSRNTRKRRAETKQSTKRLTTPEFIKRAREVHGDKYDYSRVFYNGAHEKVVIRCPAHGKFAVTPNNHIRRKSGCPKCVEELARHRRVSGHVSKVIEQKWDDRLKMFLDNNIPFVPNTYWGDLDLWEYQQRFTEEEEKQRRERNKQRSLLQQANSNPKPDQREIQRRKVQKKLLPLEQSKRRKRIYATVSDRIHSLDWDALSKSTEVVLEETPDKFKHVMNNRYLYNEKAVEQLEEDMKTIKITSKERKFHFRKK